MAPPCGFCRGFEAGDSELVGDPIRRLTMARWGGPRLREDAEMRKLIEELEA